MLASAGIISSQRTVKRTQKAKVVAMLRGGSGTKLAYLGMLALLLTMPFGIRSAQGQFFQSQVTVGSVGNKPGVEVYVEPKDPSTADTIFYKLRITGTPDDKVIKDEGKSIRLRLPQGVRLQSAQTITEGNSTVRMGGKVFRRVRILRTFYLEAENPGTYRIPGFSIDLAGSSFPVKEQSKRCGQDAK
jgi:hypothetical protein